MIKQACDKCLGTGILSLGMEFDEAIIVANMVTQSKDFWLYGIEARRRAGQIDTPAFYVYAGHKETGGTRIELKSIDDWQRRDELLRNARTAHGPADITYPTRA